MTYIDNLHVLQGQTVRSPSYQQLNRCTLKCKLYRLFRRRCPPR